MSCLSLSLSLSLSLFRLSLPLSLYRHCNLSDRCFLRRERAAVRRMIDETLFGGFPSHGVKADIYNGVSETRVVSPPPPRF